MTFRRRIIIAMVPLFALLLVLGGTATALIYSLGNGIDEILRENYASVVAMHDLNEALERIDSSFQFALAGRVDQSRRQYHSNWKRYDASLGIEQNNVTLPGEGELVDRLTKLTDRYRRQGNEFFKQAGQPLKKLYFGDGNQPGLYGLFGEIKVVSGQIMQINEANMRQAKDRAQRMARRSLMWYGVGLAVGIALALFLVASTLRTMLRPIRGDRIGHRHRRRQSGPTCSDLFGRRTGAVGGRIQRHGSPAPRLSAIARGATGPGATNQPGHDQLLS